MTSASCDISGASKTVELVHCRRSSRRVASHLRETCEAEGAQEHHDFLQEVIHRFQRCKRQRCRVCRMDGKRLQPGGAFGYLRVWKLVYGRRCWRFKHQRGVRMHFVRGWKVRRKELCFPGVFDGRGGGGGGGGGGGTDKKNFGLLANLVQPQSMVDNPLCLLERPL